jgi:DNA adenine methylase
VKVKAILGYAGAKRAQATGIVEAIGDHQFYVEPFAGSLAVLFAKPKARQEIVNDLHGGVVNLARVVQHDDLSGELFNRLSRTMFCKTLYELSCLWLEDHPKDLLVDGEPDFDWAYHYFLASWCGRSGLVGTDNELGTGFCVRYTSNGGDPATRFRNAVESIPSWWDRLRGVTTLNEDGISLLERIEDKAGTALYLDPPYFSKGFEYKHDFDEADHARLAVALLRFEKTRLVVSYYDDPRLDELYLSHGFGKVVRSTTKQMGNGRVAAPEVLLIKN